MHGNFTLTVSVLNDAFQEDMQGELHSIFAAVHEKIRCGETTGMVFDSNGNSVGRFSLDGSEDAGQ